MNNHYISSLDTQYSSAVERLQGCLQHSNTTIKLKKIDYIFFLMSIYVSKFLRNFNINLKLKTKIDI